MKHIYNQYINNNNPKVNNMMIQIKSCNIILQYLKNEPINLKNNKVIVNCSGFYLN